MSRQFEPQSTRLPGDLYTSTVCLRGRVIRAFGEDSDQAAWRALSMAESARRRQIDFANNSTTETTDATLS
jgi:hypothetical protein